MKREIISPRTDWQARVEGEGLIWHTAGSAPYWNESACYSFSMQEIEVLEKATEDLYQMFLTAGQYVVDNRLFRRFSIPEWCDELIISAWNAEPPALNYGRFDLGFDGRNPPKLFEFNCDTPTSLLEASVIQWSWKEQVFPNQDQFNSIHDKLVAKWRDIQPYLQGKVHFTHARENTGEDAVTSAYMMDVAREAGLADVDGILIEDVDWDTDHNEFVDLQGVKISTLYHLYPWEWLTKEVFSHNIALTDTVWIEPIWKMIWSNKAILPILWDLFPRHPNLLWATDDLSKTSLPMSDYVSKPILAREGGNVTIVKDRSVLASKDGAYGEYPLIYQGLYDLPNFDGCRPVIGSWIVDGAAAGMGIREDGLITGNLSRFVPHIIR